MKKNKKIAAIDIGSHNCRLMVVEKSAGKKKVIFNHSKPTNLIKNLSFNNEFNIENISKTINCLIFFKKKIDEFNILNYRCVATEACRVVINPEFFLTKVKETSGLNVDIISSEEEARLCLKSCKIHLKKIKQYGVLFDIGGGSTEITFFKPDSDHLKTTSISYGVINFEEKVHIYGEDLVRRKIITHFSQFYNENKSLSEKFVSIGSCSTMTTLCSVFQNLPFYNPSKIEGFEMSREQVINTINYINKLSLSDLKTHPCIKEKYKLLKSGIEILFFIIKVFPIKKIITTNKGLRDAIIDEL
ncbi:hypothetical protein OAY92_01550 [Alphaproteobacteria bacterium]|nr:hypothetical protein [Alphaproteobacteria bacterium]